MEKVGSKDPSSAAEGISVGSKDPNSAAEGSSVVAKQIIRTGTHTQIEGRNAVGD